MKTDISREQSAAGSAAVVVRSPPLASSGELARMSHLTTAREHVALAGRPAPGDRSGALRAYRSDRQALALLLSMAQPEAAPAALPVRRPGPPGEPVPVRKIAGGVAAAGSLPAVDARPSTARSGPGWQAARPDADREPR